MSLPTGAIIEAVYDRLAAELSETVGFAGTVRGASYVAISYVTAVAEETATSRFFTNTLSVRCHTSFNRGQTRPLDATTLADNVEAALRDTEISLDGQANLYLSAPSITPNAYEMDDGRDAYDVILQYDLTTQEV
jgi:hypothetical protein